MMIHRMMSTDMNQRFAMYFYMGGSRFSFIDCQCDSDCEAMHNSSEHNQILDYNHKRQHKTQKTEIQAVNSLRKPQPSRRF